MNDDRTIEDDPRWRRLRDRSWVCPSCRATHKGVFDISFKAPAAWPPHEPAIANQDVSVENLTHFLSDDLCLLNGEDCFIRCVLELPLIGADGAHFGFGVWSSLAKENFLRYVETFDSGEQGALGPWFGWFSNRLMGYPETLSLKSLVHPRDGRGRPWIELEPTDHPLALDQRNGISFDRLLEIYTAHGHDLRAALSD